MKLTNEQLALAKNISRELLNLGDLTTEPQNDFSSINSKEGQNKILKLAIKQEIRLYKEAIKVSKGDVNQALRQIWFIICGEELPNNLVLSKGEILLPFYYTYKVITLRNVRIFINIQSYNDKVINVLITLLPIKPERLGSWLVASIENYLIENINLIYCLPFLSIGIIGLKVVF